MTLNRTAAITGLAVLGLIGFWTLHDDEPVPPLEPDAASVAGPRAAEPGNDRAVPAQLAAGTGSQPMPPRAAQSGPTVSAGLGASDSSRPREEPSTASTPDDPAAVAQPLSQALADGPMAATGPEADPHLTTSSGAHRGRPARHSRLHGVATSN